MIDPVDSHEYQEKPFKLSLIQKEYR